MKSFKALRPFRTPACLSLLAAICLGCTPATDPLTTMREEVVSAVAPIGTGTIAEAVENLTAPASPMEMTDQVAIRGRIDAGDLDPFEPGRAAFIVSEIVEDPNAGEGHDASTCPFCKRRAEKAPKAHVILVDDADKPLDVSADKLLSVRKGAIVQVAGTAAYDEDMNTLTVRATQVHME